MKFGLNKKHIVWTIIIIVVLALALAYWHSSNACALSFEGCMLKAKTHGFIGKIFLSIGCVFKNLWCSITALF